jgi:predicted amidohydrolase YtcJ
VARSVLLRNGSIYSPVDSGATAMLVVADRVTWVGREAAAEPAAVANADEVVDLRGALVTPAFVDAHVHVLGTALTRQGIDLAATRSLREFLGRLAEYADAHPGEPIGGQGWEEHGWPEGRLPTLDELDRATAGAVAFLSRVDGHSSLVTTALLELVPEAAAADGYEGALLRRRAQSLARAAAQDSMTPDRRRELHREVLDRAAALGIGAVHEMAAPHITSERDLRSLVALASSEPLPEVVPYWGEAGPGVRRAVSMAAHGAAGDLTVDGSIGSRSARLSAPYADDPSTRGSLYLDVEIATEHVLSCMEAGIQAGFHCIGDEAVQVAVSAISRAAERHGADAVAAARHRLEHVEMISAELIDEMARLGVVASVQPAFDEMWGGAEGMYATRLGTTRAAAMNPFRTMERAGVTMAFGSDTPVTPLGGWAGVRAAVRHGTAAERISVESALAAATAGGWRAAGVDDAGTLEPGMLATYAVWDVTDVPDVAAAAAMPSCRQTVVRGRTVFPRPAGERPTG